MHSLFALAAIILGLATPSAPAAGEVAYARLTDGYWQIWVYRVDDESQRQLTRTHSDKHDPTWTPEGELLYRANDDALYRIDAQGGGERPFLSQAWPAVDPAFASDGRVAFARRRTEVRDVSAIWLAATSGANRRSITRGPGLQVHPTWSPDGAWIVFEHSRRAQGTDLRRVSPDGATNELLLEGKPGEHNQKPAFSPDGRRLAYSSSRSGNYDIWTLDPASASLASTQLTDAPALDSSPAWSPDSGSLAFTTQRRGKLEIWVMAVDGSGQRPLFEIDSAAAEPAWR